MVVRRTKTFTKWLEGLRDRQAQTRIATRIFRLKFGNAGVVRSVGGGIVEMKMDFGPGYRVYYVQRGTVLTILLCGGDKSTQSKDIELAKALAAGLEGDDDVTTD